MPTETPKELWSAIKSLHLEQTKMKFYIDNGKVYIVFVEDRPLAAIEFDAINEQPPKECWS